MFRKLRSKIRNSRLSMRMKFTLSLSAIVVILLVSSLISILEYNSMNNYVSDLIAGNIRSVNIAQRLSNIANTYNLGLLAAIGDTTGSQIPDYDEEAFMADCDSLRKALSARDKEHLADSVEYAYSAYVLTSLEMRRVMSSKASTRVWYFNRLQPVYNRLHSSLDKLTDNVYLELKKNSGTFQRGFYRSVIPGIVAVMVGILLTIMLLFFILSYYVNPLYKMLGGLENYKSVGKKYNVTFDGDDQMRELNDSISDIAEENSQLRRRLKTLRQTISQQKEANAASTENKQ